MRKTQLRGCPKIFLGPNPISDRQPELIQNPTVGANTEIWKLFRMADTWQANLNGHIGPPNDGDFV
ncbi:hypothetical protein M413DRAFT_448422 [Hebeloma cylindrosporum]|uniref:Uncharacterized protein n=1 Tax=Hebeloma cylindrosporum TaxID=76867 RepID=A0A0C3C211_HEBCY|nr:hypothetical protein M413DRAFT_448422 [Hebeloma cylindrosporum h7]